MASVQEQHRTDLERETGRMHARVVELESRAEDLENQPVCVCEFQLLTGHSTSKSFAFRFAVMWCRRRVEQQTVTGMCRGLMFPYNDSLTIGKSA